MSETLLLLGWSFFGMTLRTYHDKDLIELLERSQFSNLDHFSIIGPLLFLYFGMNLSNDGTNQLPKDEFDCMDLKVIIQGRKCPN